MKEEEAKKKKFFELYNKVQISLYCYLIAVVRNSSDADDLLQDTAIVLWDKFEQFQEGTNFKAWAFKIATNKARDYMRKNSNQKFFLCDDFYESVSQQAQNEVNNTVERYEALQFCIKKLPKNAENCFLCVIL